jgi:Domain of unknown function (DUF4861)
MLQCHVRKLPVILTVLLCCLFARGDATAQQDLQDLFQRVFGVSPNLDADTVAKVKAMAPGERLNVDVDGDGRFDEQWYTDSARRHTKRPILVRVIDEDGDLPEDGRGDLDSDLYFWDWLADGSIDAVSDYQDNDGDNDVDEMGLFFGGGKRAWRQITVWWGVDVGDDNLLWYDVNGMYHQGLCQYRSHFSGDELFYQFRLSPGADTWVNLWEDPFAFYDLDGDACSEEVVRISAAGSAVVNLRYGMDADDDAHGRYTHDYDFSVTAVAPDGGLAPDAAHVAPRQIRGIATCPVLTWESTRAFSRNAPWAKALLTWDELNSNTDANARHDPNERWEGILNAPSKSGAFPQVGGPAASKLNKRVEVGESPPQPLRLYYDTADRRHHLLGATEGYLDVDFDLDGTLDAAYTYIDSDGDGVFDHRTFDADADGETDCEWPLAGNGQESPLEFEAIAPFYTSVLTKTLDDSRVFIDVASEALDEWPPAATRVRDFFSTGLGDYLPRREAGRRIRESHAGARYYLDLIRDLLFVALQKSHGTSDGWSEVAQAYGSGDYATAAELLAEMAGVSNAAPNARPCTIDGHTYRKRIPLRAANTTSRHLDDVPISLGVERLRKTAPDFNPGNCAVVMGEYWVDWIERPHQVDTLSWGDHEELVFTADLRPGETRLFYIYYEPTGQRDPDFPQLTNAVLDNPAYVAWESEVGAFRFYTGQFDFFGKHMDRLIARPERLIYPLIDVAYHKEQDWGIDALHVNKTSGLGGLTLYTNDGAHLVQSPAGEGNVAFEHRVLDRGPVRAGVEITATNVLPDAPDAPVRLRCLIYAGHQESEIRVRVPEDCRDTQVAPGLLRLPNEGAFWDADRGVMGTWGRQGDDIGLIGLGVIVPPDQADEFVELPEERRVRCALVDGGLRYWIIGGWRRGMQFPISPTHENWQGTLTELADGLHNPPEVTIGEGEIVPE